MRTPRRQYHRALSLVIALVLLLGTIPAVAFAADDWDVPGGHYFTQTGGGGGKGFTVTDADDVRFWSEFKRLGGVQAVGYPASQRFQWDGFTVQVFQRVIFQWRPESNSVAFVNVFDRLDQLGKNQWLQEAKQTPPPGTWDEAGFSWEQIVRNRLSVLDAYPAIKTAYNNVVGDPIQANGLPTSTVTDQGNHFALRAQRVVFQQWKEDVPWARKDQVTVALGGDIAKESGILPNAAALQPLASPEGKPASPASQNWSEHNDSEKSFRYPATFEGVTLEGGWNYYVEVVDGRLPPGFAWIHYRAPFKMGGNFVLNDFINSATKALNASAVLTLGERRTISVNGATADLQFYTSQVNPARRGIAVAIQRGSYVHYLEMQALASRWDTFEPLFLEVINSYVAKAQ